jgi:choline-phosphate cytidylyltransferase
MTRSRQTNRDSMHGSDSEEDSDGKSPPRGRKGQGSAEEERQVDAQIEAMMGENSKSSGA